MYGPLSTFVDNLQSSSVFACLCCVCASLKVNALELSTLNNHSIY